MDQPVPVKPPPTDQPVPVKPPPTDHPVPVKPPPTDHPVPVKPPLADKALSEAFARLRYRDTSLLIWQQQQATMQEAPPFSYLSRSQSALYSNYGNQPVVVRDKRVLGAGADQPGPGPTSGSGSSICSVM